MNSIIDAFCERHDNIFVVLRSGERLRGAAHRHTNEVFMLKPEGFADLGITYQPVYIRYEAVDAVAWEKEK
jgi:hypothetical protein